MVDKHLQSSSMIDEFWQILKSLRSQEENLTIALSGGSSPLEFYHDLNQSDCDFSSMTFTLVDDRQVPHDHDDSNIKLVRDHLVGDRKDITLIPIKEGETHWQPDIAILGMGEDGHFASLFPSMVGQGEAFDPDVEPKIIATPPMGQPLLPRLSMNMAMISRIPHLMLLLRSGSKLELFEQVSLGEKKHLPISHLLDVVGSKLRSYQA